MGGAVGVRGWTVGREWGRFWCDGEGGGRSALLV